MSDFAGMELPDALRAIMDRRGMKMTRLAERTGIPYRSLQNYLYKRSAIPAEAYLKICTHLGVPPDYPVTGRFTLPHHEFTEAVLRAFGPTIRNIHFDEHMSLSFGPAKEEDRIGDRRTAGLLAHVISHAYDGVRELSANLPLDEDG